MKSKIDISYICSLANLGLTEEDKKNLVPQVVKIVEWVDKIQEREEKISAFTLGEKEDPIAMYLSDKFTVAANLAGIPALTLPVGLNKKNLPLGIQIMANFFQESNIFKLAFLLEKKVKFDNNKLNLHREEE